MWACRPSCRGRSVTIRSICAAIASRGPPTSRASLRLAGIPAHRVRVGARHPGGRSWRETVRHALDTGRDRASRSAGEDHHQAASRRADGRRAGRHDHLSPAGAGRHRRLHCAAGAEPGGEQANIGWLFPDPIAAGQDYFKRTGISPSCMLPACVATGREASVAAGGGVQGVRGVEGGMRGGARGHLRSRSPCPSWRSRCRPRASSWGDDFWSYGLAANRKVLETFLRHHQARACPHG